MPKAAPEVIVDGLMFPESPRWWDNQLWFSDVYGQQVYRVWPDGSELTSVAHIEGWPSGLGQLPDGGRIVTEMRTKKLWRLHEGGAAPTLFADLTGSAINELNDLVTDANGRTYSGCQGYDVLAGEDPAPGVVILTEPDGSARVVADDVLFPNGMTISPDGTTLTVAQTLSAEITAFDIDPDGSLSNRRVWASVPDTNPDGTCLDAEGAIWMASVFTGGFYRVEEGGRVTDHIPTPGRWALAPMLGGDDGRTLFLLTTDTDFERARAGDMHGRIAVAEVAVPGAGLP